MSTHYIPKDLKGETRLLVIFSVKSLVTTAIFGAIGLIFYFIFKLLKMTTLGFIFLILFALIGYAFGTVKVPRITGLKFTKNIEGDSMDDIFLRYIKFKSNRKIYSYTKEDE